MSLHPSLADQIVTHYGERLTEPPRVTHDALTVFFASGLAVELRFADAHEYSFHWLWREAELRIDTAPRHPGLATYPHHLHDAAGAVRADPITAPSRTAWANVQALLDVILADPLLKRHPG